jgi:general secretion pathway protein F/type IV pilus assembly protein PilC
MPEFEYVALQASGQEVRGLESAASEQEATRALSRRDLFPIEIRNAGTATERRTGWERKRIRPRHLAAFYSQLSDLLRSGVPLLRSLELLARRSSQPALKRVIKDVREQVADGMHLADAMARHERVFVPLVVSTIRAGEEGGFLEEVLKRIATFSRKQQELSSQVVGGLAYPVFLLTMGTIIVTAIMVFFVPKFAPIFERISSRGELPWATTALLGFSTFLQNYGVILLGLVGISAFLAWRYLLTDAGRLRLDQWRLSVYGVGPILQSFAIARFCRVLGTLLRNGVPILRSLRIAKDATGNRALTTAIGAASENIAAGHSLTQPLAASGCFPEEVVEMIAVGADANNLENVLIEIADNLESEAQRQLDLYVRMLEPVMLLVIAVLILFVVVGLLLPIFQSAGSLA